MEILANKKTSERPENYSYYLELFEKEKEHLKDLNDKINERIKFLNRQQDILIALKEEGEDINKINKIEKTMGDIYDDINRLKQEEKDAGARIAEYLNTHKWITEMLDDFNSDVEH